MEVTEFRCSASAVVFIACSGSVRSLTDGVMAASLQSEASLSESLKCVRDFLPGAGEGSLSHRELASARPGRQAPAVLRVSLSSPSVSVSEIAREAPGDALPR